MTRQWPSRFRMAWQAFKDRRRRRNHRIKALERRVESQSNMINDLLRGQVKLIQFYNDSMKIEGGENENK